MYLVFFSISRRKPHDLSARISPAGTRFFAIPGEIGTNTTKHSTDHGLRWQNDERCRGRGRASRNTKPRRMVIPPPSRIQLLPHRLCRTPNYVIPHRLLVEKISASGFWEAGLSSMI